MSLTTESESDVLARNQNSDIPNWLDGTFLEKHLRTYYNDQQITIQSFDVKSGMGKNVNYCSSIYRINITFTNGQSNSSAEEKQNQQSLKIIVKAAISGEALGALSEFDVYKKEMEFYSKIVPRIKKALETLGDTSQLTAEAFGVCDTNTAMLIEDLSAKSYGMASALKGLDLNTAKFVLKKTATFHAINAVLQQDNEKIFENFKHGLISRHSDAFNALYTTQLDILIELVETWPEFAEYVPKLRRLRPIIIEKLRTVFDVNPNDFNTLIHGDMFVTDFQFFRNRFYKFPQRCGIFSHRWVNNLLMKYVNGNGNGSDHEEQEVENVVFIDFQYSCWASPTIDLHYFLNYSLHESLRPGRFDELIEFYHGHLVNSLQTLGFNKHIPTFDEFKQQYLNRSFYGFDVACLEQPIVISGETEIADMGELVGDDERSKHYKRIMFQSPKVQGNLRKLIPIYDKMGVFD